MMLKSLIIAVLSIHTVYSSELESFPSIGPESSIGCVVRQTQSGQTFHSVATLVDLPHRPEWRNRAIISRAVSLPASEVNNMTFALTKGFEVQEQKIVEVHQAPAVTFSPWWTLGFVDIICHVDVAVGILEKPLALVTPLQISCDSSLLRNSRLREGSGNWISPSRDGAFLYYHRPFKPGQFDLKSKKIGTPLIKEVDKITYMLGMLQETTQAQDVFISLAASKTWLNSVGSSQ